MKAFFDLIPAILFLIFYLVLDIYAATIFLMVYTTLQVIWEHFRHGKVSNMVLTTFALVIPFGAITLFLHNDFFIKIKFSIFYWVLAIALLVANYFYNKNLIQLMMQKQVMASKTIWSRINLAWVIFFILVGLSNIFFIYKLPKYWIYFKFPGVPIAMLIFMFSIFGYYNKQIKFIEPTEEEKE